MSSGGSALGASDMAAVASCCWSTPRNGRQSQDRGRKLTRRPYRPIPPAGCLGSITMMAIRKSCREAKSSGISRALPNMQRQRTNRICRTTRQTLFRMSSHSESRADARCGSVLAMNLFSDELPERIGPIESNCCESNCKGTADRGH